MKQFPSLKKKWKLETQQSGKIILWLAPDSSDMGDTPVKR